MWNFITTCTVAILIFGLEATKIEYKIEAAQLDDDNIGSFWHVTDFHYDIFYGDGNYPLSSCRSTDPSDLSRWGDYNCDSPWSLINSSVNAMKRFQSKPDFIVWTGDDYPHVPSNRKSDKLLLNVIFNLTNVLMEGFPNSPVFPVLGNHDYNPTNQMPTHPNDIYNTISNYWEPWLGNYTGVMESFREAAFYTTLCPTSGFRIVAINTVFYYKDEETSDEADPGQQFIWLEETLAAARENNEKVLIIGHVTPGAFERSAGKYWFTEHQDVGDPYDVTYYNIIVQYHDVIAGQLYGHQHTDSFKIFYSEKDTDPVSALFVAPAVTPWNTTLAGVGANNPGIRLFKYQRNDGTLIDWEQYYLDLSKVTDDDIEPLWQLAYRASESYDLMDLSAQSMHNLVDSFETDDSSTFESYYFHNSVDYDSSKCAGSCKQAHVCAITKVDRASYESCIQFSGADVVKTKGVLVMLVVLLLTCAFNY